MCFVLARERCIPPHQIECYTGSCSCLIAYAFLRSSIVFNWLAFCIINFSMECDWIKMYDFYVLRWDEFVWRTRRRDGARMDCHCFAICILFFKKQVVLRFGVGFHFVWLPLRLIDIFSVEWNGKLSWHLLNALFRAIFFFLVDFSLWNNKKLME